MRHRFEPAAAGAIAALASLLAILATPAAAGDGPAGLDAGAARPAPCGASGQPCTRINGYIRAGAEFPDSSAKRSARFGEPPRLPGIGVAGRVGAETPSDGFGFLKVSGDQAVR